MKHLHRKRRFQQSNTTYQLLIDVPHEHRPRAERLYTRALRAPLPPETWRRAYRALCRLITASPAMQHVAVQLYEEIIEEIGDDEI